MKLRVLILALMFAMVTLAVGQSKPPSNGSGWKTDFQVDMADLGPTGVNPYFRLEPGYQLFYKRGQHTDTVTVLNRTKMIDGVETRVVEDKETENGMLTELTHDYFAIDRSTNSVYYFGEDVDEYKKGKVVAHGGSWLSGVNGAHFGLMMPGNVEIGQKFYEELAPHVGMDRAEVVSKSARVDTPYGSFNECIQIKETSPLEPRASEMKYYSSGVGLVKEPEFSLVSVKKPAVTRVGN